MLTLALLAADGNYHSNVIRLPPRVDHVKSLCIMIGSAKCAAKLATAKSSILVTTLLRVYVQKS
jgi:hypothetical protein